MKLLRLDWLIKSIICFALLSFLISFILLIDPFSLAGPIASRTSLSQSISSSLALIIGTIAIVVTVGIERTEYRAQESLRKDLMILSATIHTLILKSVSATIDEFTFVEEQKCISQFLCSTTGFAFICWCGEKSIIAQKNSEQWRTFLYQLSDISRSDDKKVQMTVLRTADDILSCLAGC